MYRQREALHRGRQPDLSPELQVQPNSPRTVPERHAWARLADCRRWCCRGRRRLRDNGCRQNKDGGNNGRHESAVLLTIVGH